MNSPDDLSISFGDSMGDFPMLKSTNIGFLVTHDKPELIQAAKENNWYIPQTSEQIISDIQNHL